MSFSGYLNHQEKQKSFLIAYNKKRKLPPDLRKMKAFQ